MSGKRTTLFAENMTLSTGSVLAAFQTAASGSAAANIRISRMEITQSGSTTLAMIRGAISKRDTAGTLTTTSTTPVANPVGGAASGLAGNSSVIGAVARSGTASSADSGGAYTDQRAFNFANLNGYLWKPDPDEELWVPPSTVLVVRLLAAPGTLTGWTICIDLEEY